MQSLWQDVYLACGGAEEGNQARRLANLALALHFRQADATRDKASFFAEVADVATLLGGPLPVKARVKNIIWLRLMEAPTVKPTNAIVDAWIEAFQAADSARKSLGAYATPVAFSDALARETLTPLLTSKPRAIRIVDPAAGAGSLLLAAHRCLVEAGYSPEHSVECLHGIELDAAARELCVLMLWVSAGASDDVLTTIAANIRLANAITFDWASLAFFDAVLMNPPWESLRQTRSDAAQAQVRADTLARINHQQPGASGLPPLFSAQGRGDRNLFKLFVELAPHLLRKGGRLGAILPAAFGSDDGMTALREFYLAHFALERWTSFENRGKYFQIDSRYKFGLLTGTRASTGTERLDILSFCMHPHDVRAPHVRLARDEISTLGGKGYMIPELVSSAERDVLAQMLSSGTPLFERGPLALVKYRREVDLTLGRRASQFWHVDELRLANAKPDGQFHFEDRNIVPLLEGRMIGQYDCFQKSWVSGSSRRAVWETNGAKPLSACRSQFVTHARQGTSARIAICDVTSATNTRTVLAALVPPMWVCGNTAPVLAFDTQEHALAALAIMNSMTFDWFARRMVGGLHLNKFYLARLTWPRLTVDDVARLATLARTIAAAHPRGGVPSRRVDLASDITVPLAEVEILVARGYDLATEALRAIFNGDRSDRRGLWRYFAANPTGREVAALAITGLERSPDPEKTLAA